MFVLASNMNANKTWLQYRIMKRKRMFMKAAVRAKRAQKRREAFQRRQAQQRLVFALILCSFINSSSVTGKNVVGD